MNKERCLRCGYIWLKRVDNPVMCPKCRSPYWNRKRMKEVNGKTEKTNS